MRRMNKDNETPFVPQWIWEAANWAYAHAAKLAAVVKEHWNVEDFPPRVYPMLAAVLAWELLEERPTIRKIYYTLQQGQVILREDQRDPPRHYKRPKDRKQVAKDRFWEFIYNDLTRVGASPTQLVIRRNHPKIHFRSTINLHTLFVEADSGVYTKLMGNKLVGLHMHLAELKEEAG
jgi:hypothetical protein